MRRWPIAGLVVALVDGEAREQMLALWVLGRCHQRKVLPVMFTLRRSSHRGVRKQLVKALRRLGAWKELSDIAPKETDRQIRPLATAMPPAPFSQRLGTFTRNTTVGDAAPAVCSPLRLLICLPLSPARPPKVRWQIRAILERIRELLRGNASTR
jgi:hypothetical protein